MDSAGLAFWRATSARMRRCSDVEKEDRMGDAIERFVVWFMGWYVYIGAGVLVALVILSILGLFLVRP